MHGSCTRVSVHSLAQLVACCCLVSEALAVALSDRLASAVAAAAVLLCREYRVLLGHARLADVFVDTSRIGTDALFERCTHFAPLDTTSLGSWHRPQML